MAERRIPTLMGRARAMLIQAGIDSKGKVEFWCGVISTATKLDNIMVRPQRTKPPYTLFCSKDTKYMKYMRTFGEMAFVAIHEGKKMRSKLDNRGKTCWKPSSLFSNVHFRNTTKIAAQVFALNFGYLYF